MYSLLPGGSLLPDFYIGLNLHCKFKIYRLLLCAFEKKLLRGVCVTPTILIVKYT
jgi:hypothetical protein